MYRSTLPSYRSRGPLGPQSSYSQLPQSQIITPVAPHPSTLTSAITNSSLPSPYFGLYSPRSSNSTISSYTPQPRTPLFSANIYPSQNTITLGLVNLGNTCYMSSVLQVLFDILTFEVHFNDKKEVTEAYMRLLNSHSDLDCEMFKKTAGKKIQMIDDYDQQDAHEFLCQILESLNRQNQYAKYFSKISFTINPSQSVYSNWQNYCYQMQKSDNSLVTRLFGGEIYTELKCPENHPNYLFQRVLNLSLAFPDKPQYNHIQDFLTHHFEPELIDGVTCEQCNSNVQMIKQSFIYNLPRILVLHLKRFKLGYFSNSKIRTGVLFDQVLSVSPGILHGDMRANTHSYRLFAVVHHEGGLNGGHYYTQKRIGNKWYLFNDKRVSESRMLETRNRSDTAYMLFYGML